MRILKALFVAGILWAFTSCALVLAPLATIIPTLVLIGPLIILPHIYPNESRNQ